MDKFVIRRKRSSIQDIESSNNVGISKDVDISEDVVAHHSKENISGEKRKFHEDVNVVSDPALRMDINSYDQKVRDEVMRTYALQGPCQPYSHTFPKRKYGEKNSRSFQSVWFKEWEWLDYSISKDEVFCLWCYLFRVNSRNEVFTRIGFHNWKDARIKFKEHVGAEGSAHNNAMIMFFAFKNQKQSLQRKFMIGSQALEYEYYLRLNDVVKCVRYLLQQGLAFRGHNEMKGSLNRGNLLELLELYSSVDVEAGKVMNENAPGNHKLYSPSIQKDIVRACGAETTIAIIRDIGDKFFTLLVDEARDSSIKEQMAIVLRYVNNQGVVMERFIGVVHVANTTSLSLKRGIDEIFSKHGLSISKLRGQGYDGASNMRGALNGLKTLILNENPNARYIHCFAHQLQLVVVAVARSNQFVVDFFEYLSMITNMIGVSCKRKDEFREAHREQLIEELANDEIQTGTGLNQESSLARPGITRWGSHFTTIIRLLSLWPSTINVLTNIFSDGADNGGIALSLINKMESYEFVFMAHLMKLILGITNTLSHFLQKEDQNIMEATFLIKDAKRRLLELREDGWNTLLEDVNKFCVKYDLLILNMEDKVKSRLRLSNAATNEFHFRIDIFYQVIDRVIQEMESRFSESSTELLTCIGCLDPKDSFSNFSIPKIVRLAELYPDDFSTSNLMRLEEELKSWIIVMRENDSFSMIQDLGDVATKMVKLGYDKAFPMVYLVLELVLVLPVATATVERAFSAMKIIKTHLRNKIGDEFLNDSLVCYIERDVFKSIGNEVILRHFQNMKTRKQDLPLVLPL